MKKHVPDLERVVTALVGRMDSLEKRTTLLEALGDDVASLGRGLANVSAQLRDLSETTAAQPVRSAGPSAVVIDGEDVEEAEGVGQPDWLTVSDPVVAAGWLADAVLFVQDVLAPAGAAPAAACWPLHPGVVVEVLALQAVHRAAYTGEDPTPVAEYLSRWLPGASARIGEDLAACTAERGHRHDGALYAVPHLDPIRVAAWWSSTHGHDPDETEAFAMTRLI